MPTIQQQIQQNPIVKQLQAVDSNTWGMLVILFVIAVLKFRNKDKGGVVGRSRMATMKEVKDSEKLAIKVINEPREMTLWVGMPEQFSISPSGKIHLVPHKHTVILRKCNEHIMCWGGSGAGKSRYFLNPIARSAILLELAGIIVDLKGDEERGAGVAPSSELAGFALEQGYEVFTIAPFFDDSHCLNIVQLLESPSDTATATTVGNAIVINGLAPGEKPNQWDESGGQLVAAGLLMSRSQAEGRGDDLAMTQKFIARLASDPKSIKSVKLGQYTKAAFEEFLSTADSPETAASVAFSALRMMSKILTPQITSVFCRGTNVPIVLKKKQLLIFRIDPQHEVVCLPLVSAAIEIVIKRNLYSGLSSGGFALLDELPQYRLPTLAKLAAVARSKNWAFIYGAQEENILEMSYGEAQTKAILGNCQTVALMRIAGIETAKKYSEALGKEDVKTKSNTFGKNSSTTAQESQRDLVPTEEIQQQPTGRCILWTPTVEAVMSGGLPNEKRVRIPYRLQIKLPPTEENTRLRSIRTYRKYKPFRQARSVAKPLSERELEGRELLVEELLPPSKGYKKGSKQEKDLQEELRDLYSEISF
jgi:type IV secretory pathway TraG/TraD family ATPase VirD4